MFEPMDGVTSEIVGKSGIAPGTLSTIMWPHVTSALVGVPIDLLATKLGGKLIKTGTGLALAAAVLGADLGKSPRNNAEIMEWATNWMTSILDPSVEDLQAINRDLGNLKAGISFSDNDRMMQAFFRDPNEVQAWYDSLNTVFGNVMTTSFGGSPTPSRSPAMAPEDIEVDISPEEFSEEVGVDDLGGVDLQVF